MLTTSWGEPESVKWMNDMYTVIININIKILQRCAENYHKQIVTKQEYKIISILPRGSLQGYIWGGPLKYSSWEHHPRIYKSMQNKVV